MKEISLLDSPEIKNIHFIGIGGISMSGLAEILLSLGYRISGSDIRESNITKRLETLGIKVFCTQIAENIQSPDLVVYTAAVKENNPEMLEVRKKGIPAIERAVLLGQIMKRYPYSIAVSGTHGKTTTTSMVSMIMLESGLDPTIHVGGVLDAIGGNTKIGGEKYFVAEACEYVESFLKFYPYLAIILNIEADHLDYFKDLEHVKSAFSKFTSLISPDGFLIACADDENTLSILNNVKCKVIKYGITAKDADWKAKDLEFMPSGCSSFSVFKGEEELGKINLCVPGVHNVNNALASIAACHTLGCSFEDIKRGLEKFNGTHRRFEHKGILNGIKVVDDYAHHPSEVMATLKAAKNCGNRKTWCIFQPHTYTRTKALLEDFSNAFYDADNIIVADIYAAREVDNGEIHSRKLVEKLVSNGVNALYINNFSTIIDHIISHAEPGDLVITMGAGDIYKVGEGFLTAGK